MDLEGKGEKKHKVLRRLDVTEIEHDDKDLRLEAAAKPGGLGPRQGLAGTHAPQCPPSPDRASPRPDPTLKRPSAQKLERRVRMRIAFPLCQSDTCS